MAQPLRISLSGPSVRKGWLLAGWALVLLVIYLSLTPAPIQVSMELGDKFEHVLAYAVLMFWFASLYERPARRAMLAIGFVAMGIVLEYIQRWSGYRLFEIADMVAGATGVAAGWAVASPRTPNCLTWLEKRLRK